MRGGQDGSRVDGRAPTSPAADGAWQKLMTARVLANGSMARLSPRPRIFQQCRDGGGAAVRHRFGPAAAMPSRIVELSLRGWIKGFEIGKVFENALFLVAVGAAVGIEMIGTMSRMRPTTTIVTTAINHHHEILIPLKGKRILLGRTRSPRPDILLRLMGHGQNTESILGRALGAGGGLGARGAAGVTVAVGVMVALPWILVLH
mmetsp:Transcript_363/g.752  ORF Transcript_363/g.752 Transcript_363/m.752 type:complete len:204 (-) Transcript_363:1528-2139(-)